MKFNRKNPGTTNRDMKPEITPDTAHVKTKPDVVNLKAILNLVNSEIIPQPANPKKNRPGLFQPVIKPYRLMCTGMVQTKNKVKPSRKFNL